MKDFIAWAVERFGESAQALGQSRSALDKVLQRERNAGTPAQTFTNIMQVIGEKSREKAEKDFGSYYGVANGGLGILDFFFSVRGLGDWQKKLQAPSTKLTNAEEELMAALAEGDEELVVPEGATIKTSALLKKTMAKLGLRGDDGIARAKMIIQRAAQVREQQQAFEKTQMAIFAARQEASYVKLLTDGAFAQAAKMLQKAGATEQEARDAAKKDLKTVYLGIESDEDLEALVMMIPGDVLGEAEATEWAKERAQGTTKKTGKPAEEKPAPKAKKPKAKKAASLVESTPTTIDRIVVDPKTVAVVEEKPAVKQPDLGAPEEFVAPKAEDPALVAQVAPVDDVTAQLMSARRKELLAKSKKDLRKRAAELEIEVQPEILAATGDGVVKAKEWLADRIIEKEFAAVPAA